MTYTLVQPPGDKPFSRMNKTEAVEYFEWFVGAIPDRLRVLEQAVQNSAEFEGWTANKSPRSLLDLGSWFAGQVGTQPATASFSQFVKENLKAQNPLLPTYDTHFIPSDKTLSLTVDIGMYLGEVFTKNFQRLHWGICDLEGNIDYNQPVIKGLRSIDNKTEIHCPTERLVHVLALGFINKTRSHSHLFELYKKWSPSSPD